jgi:hypothetical protein
LPGFLEKMVQGPGRASQHDARHSWRPRSFSLLQSGLKHRNCYRIRIRITPAIRAQLDDFKHLARDLGSRPTSLSEIVPDISAALGASDAAKSGMGGVWIPATTHSNLRPIL